MDIYLGLFYVVQLYVIFKNCVQFTLEQLLEIPLFFNIYSQIRAFLINLHNQFYHIRTEPSDISWISLSYIMKEDEYIFVHDDQEQEQDNVFDFEPKPTNYAVDSGPDSDSETGSDSNSNSDYESDYMDLSMNSTSYKPNYHTIPRYYFMENYITQPSSLFGYSVKDHIEHDADETSSYLFPSVNNQEKHNQEKEKTDNNTNSANSANSEYKDSIFKSILYTISRKYDPEFPVMYMLKTADEDMMDYTKNPLDFFSYMIVHFMDQENNQEIVDKLTTTIKNRKPSKLRFLSVDYSHPDMQSRVSIHIPENMFYVGNELLSSTFLLRYLEYYLGKNNFVFDTKYRVFIVTNNIDYIELTSDKYLLLDSVGGYKVMSWPEA